MVSGTLLQNLRGKFVVMLLPNLRSNPLLVSRYILPQITSLMPQDWTSRQMVFGTVISRVHFFDVRIFNPSAHACCHRPLSLCYRHHEFEKRRQYEDRVLQVEHGSFTPPIFLTAGGVGPSATVIFKCLASLLATKQGTHYSKVM